MRGPVTFAPEHVPDFVLVRGNGEPLYTLVNPVDDALMRITHVLRGEDLLSSTPRQIALYDALAEIGVSDGTTPRFGHLPYVMGEGNKKLSKRDPQSSLNLYREEGFLPEGLLNYLALLGWSMGEDREFFSKEQMAAAFSLERVSANPARFDLKKCTAINADWMRALPADELARRVQQVLVERGVLLDPVSEQDARTLARRSRWSRSGWRPSARPWACSASCSSTRRPSPPTPTTPPGCSARVRARAERRPRRAGGPRTGGRPPRSRRPCVRP